MEGLGYGRKACLGFDRLNGTRCRLMSFKWEFRQCPAWLKSVA